MDFALQLSDRLLNALLQLLVQPFYYIGILFVILQYRRQIQLERKLFHTRLHSLVQESWRTLLWGIAGGFFASFIMVFIGAGVTLSAVILLWAISLILAVFRVRYLCIAYSVGVLGILHGIVGIFPSIKELDQIHWLADTVAALPMSSLLALVAVLHLVEALLVRLQGARGATPMFFEGKRGKIVGGYHLHGFWPVPLFLLVPAQDAGAALPWSPLFGGGMWADGWTLAALPVVIGFAELTMSRLPAHKVKKSSSLLLAYSVIVFGLAVCAEFWPIFAIGASLLCLLLHEVLIWYSEWVETQSSPLFVHDERGLFVLGVLPGSPAQEMDIQAGEIVHKVNGAKVGSKELFHQALQLNAAFCKLEIINRDGQTRFVKRALFAGEHHQLGIILAPDERAQYYVGLKQTSIWSFFGSKLSGLIQKPSKGM